MKVSVIIVNYNTVQMTQRCIDSVFKKTDSIDFEVIVVDNASSDGSKDILSKDGRIKYIYNNKNLGFGTANNIGYAHSNGDYIFLLNSDTELINNAIYCLSQYLQNNIDVGALGGMLYNQDDIQTMSYGKFPNGFKIICEKFIGITRRIFLIKNHRHSKAFVGPIFKSNIIDVDFVSGADLMIPRSVIEKIGFFDEKFFLYYEETDLQYRMKREGYKRQILTDAKIYHLEKGSFNNSKNIRLIDYHRIYMTESLQYYIKKHSSIINYIFFRIFFLILQIPHIFNYKYSFKHRLLMLKVIFS